MLKKEKFSASEAGYHDGLTSNRTTDSFHPRYAAIFREGSSTLGQCEQTFRCNTIAEEKLRKYMRGPN